MSDRPSAGRVVVTYPGFDDGDARTAGLLRTAGHEVVVSPRTADRTAEQVRRVMAGAIAGIVSTDPFDASVLAASPHLRVLARVGIGLDSIDVAAATRAGVAVTTTPGVNTAAVADHTLALILACCRRLVQNDHSIRAGAWDRGGSLLGVELTGATVGVVGLGATGLAVTRRLAGFAVRVLASELRPPPTADVTLVPLDELLATAAVVTMHVPLTPATRHLIGARELALMRPGAILVNTSRGGVIDEDALVAALRDGHLGGAGLDVFDREPPAGSPLLVLPNVIVTPHVAGISVRAQDAMLAMAVDSVLDVLAGRLPPGIVNPDVLEGPRSRPPAVSG